MQARVWNEAALVASRDVIVCEALIDAMTFWCAGYRNVITAFGVNGFTRDHWAALKRHGTQRAGMRRAELANLHLHDIDYERGVVTIRQGKGKKDRVIPIGERALSWIVKYRDDARGEWVTIDDDGTLFLTHRGCGFVKDSLGHVVRRYIDAADIGKRGSCHLFRHTMATLMIENGADVSFVQSMLGHVNLSSTQVYTHIAIRKLKEVHSATHPAQLTRRLKKGETK